jgi:hypothetical protein
VRHVAVALHSWLPGGTRLPQFVGVADACGEGCLPEYLGVRGTQSLQVSQPRHNAVPTHAVLVHIPSLRSGLWELAVFSHASDPSGKPAWSIPVTNSFFRSDASTVLSGKRGSLRAVVHSSRAPSPKQSAVGRSNGRDSRNCLQSGLRLGLAQGLPVAVGAVVLEIRQVGVLRR